MKLRQQVHPLSRARQLFWATVLTLLLSFVLYAVLPQRHLVPTIAFYTATVLALFCNINMVGAGLVGKTSPYVFVVATLTIIGFFPMLGLMGYTLFLGKGRP
ncbi:hypothetical protein Q3O98_11355 [Ralstonia pseudosolanacearum]|nr:hypothetical protein [Ralstonia pseudosolanacearum]